MIVAVPYKIHGGSGGPVRVFALPSATYAARVDIGGGGSGGSNRFAFAPACMVALASAAMVLFA